jgi:hypothetical protein
MTTVRFGAKGYSDYTLHTDPVRRDRYLRRHQSTEDWSNYTSAGFWARWLLWNQPSLKQSAADITKRFGIHFTS